MVRSCKLGWGCVAVALAGCGSLHPLTEATPAAPPPTGHAAPLAGPVDYNAAAARPQLLQTAAASAVPSPGRSRVEAIGQQLVTANPQLALKPNFVVTGTPIGRISHQGDRQIAISEGLLNQLSTDAQLAAVLALELGKMAAERQQRRQDLEEARLREPPLEVRIGPDARSAGEADQFYRAEVARLGLDRRTRPTPPAPVDPADVARRILANAGYPESSLDAAPR